MYISKYNNSLNQSTNQSVVKYHDTHVNHHLTLSPRPCSRITLVNQSTIPDYHQSNQSAQSQPPSMFQPCQASSTIKSYPWEMTEK